MKMKYAFLAGIILLGSAAAAQAAQPRLLASYGNWSAYTFTEDGNKVCYMASKPTDEHGDYTKRGEIFALLTHRPGEGTENVFSYITGYGYKAGSDARVEIDDQVFTLFTQDDTAWAHDSRTDNALAKAIKSGSKMVVYGTSSRGTQTTDNFSLNGSSKAYERISQECGV